MCPTKWADTCWISGSWRSQLIPSLLLCTFLDLHNIHKTPVTLVQPRPSWESHRNIPVPQHECTLRSGLLAQIAMDGNWIPTHSKFFLSLQRACLLCPGVKHRHAVQRRLPEEKAHSLEPPGRAVSPTSTTIKIPRVLLVAQTLQVSIYSPLPTTMSPVYVRSLCTRFFLWIQHYR